MLGHALCHALSFHSQTISHSITNNQSYYQNNQSYRKTINPTTDLLLWGSKCSPNTTNLTIKFDITYSTHEINFLDTTIYFNLQCHKLYVKQRNICVLSHAHSFQPNNSTWSVINSQALHYQRIIIDNSLLHTHLQALWGSLLRLGCEIKYINSEFQKISNFRQKDLLDRDKPNKETCNIFPLIITFDEINKLIGPILRKHWEITQND